ncbi:MAG: HDOD domain-containing protein [Chromatiaceae bacterium]|nr:HDOD domain-containing protein [Chromatiaceae bacterium]
MHRISMLADLLPWQFEAVAEAVEPVEARKGTLIVERGSDDGYTYFLSEGEVSLEAADGVTTTVDSSPETLRTPVANLRPRILGVTALSRVRGLRIPDIVLTAAGCNGKSLKQGLITDEDEDDAERREAESRLSFQIYRDLKSNKAILPSLPDLALRIRRAIEDDVSDARTVARLVESDPSMAAKILKAANSAMYGGMATAETCSAAVVRLGMQTTKQLVLTFALKEVFQTKNPMVRNRMQVLWKHSSQIAALCFVLAREIKGMQAEEALLIGLLHDVGAIAILNYIEKYPDLGADEDGLEETISRMRGELGAMILRNWMLPAPVVAGARDAEYWLRQHQGPADFTDLLVVAQVHERLRKDQLNGLPPLKRSRRSNVFSVRMQRRRGVCRSCTTPSPRPMRCAAYCAP